MFNINFTVANTPDQESGLLTIHKEVYETILQQDQRMTLYRSEDSADYKIKHLMGSFNMNLCKLFEGVKNNVVMRIMSESYLKSMSSKITCPIVKGTKYSMVNMTLTDQYFPPLAQTRFKFHHEVSAKIQGQKKFVKVYWCTYYFTVKK